MRSLMRAAVILPLFFVLCGLAAGQVPITASSSTTTSPSTLAPLSFDKKTLAPGPNTVTIDIAPDINGFYTGQFVLMVAYQGTAGPLRLWPSASITNSLIPNGTGISANASGLWSATIQGPGFVYIVATSLSAGQPTAFLSAGQGGSLGSGGGGGSAPNPYGASLGSFEFAGVSSAVTFNVTYLDAHFVKVGTLISYSVPVANPGVQAGVTFATIAGGSLPAGAVYALVRTSANAYYDTGAGSPSDFTANTTSAPILIGTPDYQMFGGTS